MMQALDQMQLLAVFALPVLLAITVHEAAHGWVAHKLGDDTAYKLGRVSFNPLRHIDPIGTIAVPLGIFLTTSALSGTGMLFGWAKPVPINWRNLRHPRRDVGLVAVAGPAANLLMALFWGLVIYLGLGIIQTSQWVALPLVYAAASGVFINVFLMALNLFPLPPLDGGRVLTVLLPSRLGYHFARLEPFGLIIVLLLLVSGLLGNILLPFVIATLDLLPGSGVVKELFFV